MRKGGGGSKGGAFEREICTKLSLWWTGGERDDVFWRVRGSGGRATIRQRKGKKTAGGCGDVCATDEVGRPLLRACALEIKRGYNRDTLVDLLDAPLPKSRRKPAVQLWQEWIEQAEQSMTASDSNGWMILARRDKRRLLAVMPAWMFYTLTPHCLLDRAIFNIGDKSLVVVSAWEFLELAKPQAFAQLASCI